MPRPSLPSNLKGLQTIDVLLTQTTEEQLWAHFKILFAKYETSMEVWEEKIERMYRKFNPDRNPYNDHNWRSGHPTRHYKNPTLGTVVGFDEADSDLYWTLFNFVGDFYKVNKALKWNEDAEYSEEYGKMSGTIEYLRMRTSGGLSTLAEYEDQCFYLAKKRWEELDADWIADQKLKKAHYGDNSYNGHHPFDYVEFEKKRLTDLLSSKSSTIEYLKRKKQWNADEDENVQIGPKLSISIEDSQKLLDSFALGNVPGYTLTCKYCIKSIQESKEADERRRLEEEAYEIERQHELDEQKLEAEKEKERRKALPVVHYNCELCKYHTTSLGYYQYHTESKDHLRREKMGELFCKVCEVPSRTQAEYDNHCNTTKHRKATGQIEAEPEEYRCAPCEYYCKGKMLWKQHCGTKKHIEKTSST
jgi:hypothetical protein